MGSDARLADRDETDTANGSLVRCLGCDYDLRALLQHRCPECGRPFDPADPFSVRGVPRPHDPPAPVRSGVALVGSFLSVCLFLLNDPWSVRDGNFALRLAEAYPFFILSPTLAWYAGWVGRRNRVVRQAAIVLAAAFVLCPLTWRYGERVATDLIPMAAKEIRVWLS